MRVQKLVVGRLQTNCYLVYDRPGSQVFIIDPGDDAGYIINKINDLDLTPKAILATHGHFDHVLAVPELKLAYNLPFYLASQDRSILKRQQSTARFFTGIQTDPPIMPDKNLKEGQNLETEEFQLAVLATPGHTPGGVSFYSKEAGVVFVGDLIFKGGGIGRTDLKGGDWQRLQNSIKKIRSLTGDPIVYPGHGQKFKLSSLTRPG